MKTVHNLEGNINYKLLRDAIADCVVKQVAKNVKAFFEAIKKWKKHPEEFKAKPEFPHFLGRNSMNLLQIRYGHDCKIDKMGNITLNGMPDVKIPIPQWGKYADAISKGCKQVRILPNKGFMTIEVVYEAFLGSSTFTNHTGRFGIMMTDFLFSSSQKGDEMFELIHKQNYKYVYKNRSRCTTSSASGEDTGVDISADEFADDGTVYVKGHRF